ncbi:MAG: glucosaminidase domain-containing protein, partial [Erysipelotrichaceae bacterium]|nr:glucosaminidase domain-containing protein [Erysipelotrichaceae bacterium]
MTDKNSGLDQFFSSYGQAYDFYNENLDRYDNLLLLDGDRIIHMEYGFVEFVTDEACSLGIEYYSETKDGDDYLNGCYGIDGAYLYTGNDGKRVYFMISDDLGSVDLDKVILHPYDTDQMISSYTVLNGQLVHNIRTRMDQDYYSYSVVLDDALPFMKEGDVYYSYDGHYFYDDYPEMIDDLRSGIHDNVLNQEAYYNYYQFLPHRSLSNYSAAELEYYFSILLGIRSRLTYYNDSDKDGAADEISSSQLYRNTDSFFIYQNIYGANAMMLLSSAVYESSYGRSKNAFLTNSLYVNTAYDSQEEREAGRYSSIDSSIRCHAKHFISALFSSHLKSFYSGTFYGNKQSGINVNYSYDPYYGEKSTSVYYKIDKLLGEKDRNAYAVGIIRNRQKVSFYQDDQLDELLYSLRNVETLSFVILDETEDSFKIQIDDSF